MGMAVDVRLRFVVGEAEGDAGDAERLFGLLRDLAAGGIRVLEPMRVVRLARLDRLQCTVNSYLRTATGFERYFSRRKSNKTHLPSLCRRYSVAAEVWTHCGEAGYDEHFVVGYDGKVLTNESYETTPFDELSPDWSPGPEEAAWNARWGKWQIPWRDERAATVRHAETGVIPGAPFPW